MIVTPIYWYATHKGTKSLERSPAQSAIGGKRGGGKGTGGD